MVADAEPDHDAAVGEGLLEYALALKDDLGVPAYIKLIIRE